MALIRSVIGLASGVPAWVWALAAALIWGGFNRHAARSERVKFQEAEVAAAVAQAASAAEAKAETARREAEKKGAIDEARKSAARARAALLEQQSAAGELRDRLAVLEARACGGDPGSGGGGAGAAEARDLSAYLRRRLDEAEARTIEFADGSARARDVCERQYRALKPRASEAAPQ